MSAHKILDWVDVPLLHALAIGVTFTNVEVFLKIASLLLAIGYTTWKWVSEYKKAKNGTNTTKKDV